MEMKFWILNERCVFNGDVPLRFDMHPSREKAMQAVEGYRKDNPYSPRIGSIQQVKICSDRLLLMLMKSNSVNNWNITLLRMIKNKDPNITLHPSIPV